MSGGLRVSRESGVAHVTLTRPEVRNAFNAELIEPLRETFEELAALGADELRLVILAGEGSFFCAGADVDWMRAAIGLSFEENERDAAAMRSMFATIDECPAPVVARVQGGALGGGMGLCAVSDIVVATDGATFGFTETKLGILPAVISTFVIPKIGETHARALFLSGERFSAQHARFIGIVHEIVEDEPALDSRLSAIAHEFLAAGPTAVRAAKKLVRELRGLSAAETATVSVARIAEQRTSAEGQEGLTAFTEQRPPSWRPD
jgi:methylglutaconyl-CoA hydratase